jgi:hypothetical protein
VTAHLLSPAPLAPHNEKLHNFNKDVIFDEESGLELFAVWRQGKQIKKNQIKINSKSWSKSQINPKSM